MGMFHLLGMPGIVHLVTMRRACVNTVSLQTLVRRFGGLGVGLRPRCGRIGGAGDASCKCRRGQHGGREQNGREFPVHSHSSFGAFVDWDRPQRSCDHVYAA